MNVKFGMDNFYTRYLKRFLNYEMTQTTTILGKFNKDDLNLLTKYLKLPNIKDMFTVRTELVELFPLLNTHFNIIMKDDAIQWTSKTISTTESNFIMDNIENIKNYCESVGWELSSTAEWIDLSKDVNSDGCIDIQDRDIIYNIAYNNASYSEEITRKADLNLDGTVNSEDVNIIDNYLISGKLYLEVKQSKRKNYFPNSDMLVFINQFDGTFLYNYAIQDGIGIDNIPHINASGDTKIALYKCTPGQQITIAHNGNSNTNIIIGSSPAILKQDLTSFMLQNVVSINLKAGEGYQYTVPSVDAGTGYNCNWVCIQCDSNWGNLTGETSVTLELEMGDINFDGRIDLQDYHLLASYTATGPGSEELHWEATDKQKAVMDINRDGVINNEDTLIMWKFLNNDPSIPSLGLRQYTYNIPSEYDEGDNISNFLIIDGHYDRSVNIPFKEFTVDDWVIHHKFFNYLLGMAIHNYTNSENISYLQKLMKVAYPQYTYQSNFFYPGTYSDNMKQLLKDYQKSKVNYTLGDLNKDNRLDSIDLQIMRVIVDDAYDLNLITDFLNGLVVLTPQEQARLDVNHDGVVNDQDRIILQSTFRNLHPETQTVRADINEDGRIDELDYNILQDEVNGVTDNLKNYDISFILGWYDIQTEGLFETDFNISGNISEVSK